MRHDLIKRSITLSLSLWLCLSTTVVFSTGIYKWTDSNGDIHYGDQPTTTAKEIKIKTNHEPDKNLRDRLKKRERLLNVFQEERHNKKAEQVIAAQQKAEHEKKCSVARQNLNQYKTANYLYKLDDEGNRYILQDKEYALAMERAEDTVAHWCS